MVKFQNNPQHVRVLANELLATRLAAAVGLSVPACEVVEVTEWLIAHTPEMRMEMGPETQPCRPGLQFGSRLVGGLMPGMVVDYLPEEQLVEVRNLGEFAGMLLVDKWTCECEWAAGGLSQEAAGEAVSRRRSSTRDIASTRGNGG